MRILVVGPDHAGSSLSPYLEALAAGLSAQGANVGRLGAPCLPYDQANHRFWPADQIRDFAATLLDQVDLMAYDLLSIHFGNLEIEQLLPVLWEGQPRPPAVYHVHSLDWTLFASHVPSAALRRSVGEAVTAMDGHVFFGKFARQRLAVDIRAAGSSRVCFWPTTIPDGTAPNAPPRLARVLTGADPSRPLATLLGFASPWKNMPLLLNAFERMTTPMRFVVAGPLWDEMTLAGADLARFIDGPVLVGPVQVSLVPDFLDAGARAALVAASDFAAFPYQPEATFQGSGAIGDYLAAGVPIVATDVANMAEVIDGGGLVVPHFDARMLAEAVDRLASDQGYRESLRRIGRGRSALFSSKAHAAACMDLYRQVVDRGELGVSDGQLERDRCPQNCS